MTINEDKIRISIFFWEIDTIPIINIQKIIQYKNRLSIKIVYIGNINNNQYVIDISLLRRKKFISYALSLGILVETREKFAKGRLY